MKNRNVVVVRQGDEADVARTCHSASMQQGLKHGAMAGPEASLERDALHRDLQGVLRMRSLGRDAQVEYVERFVESSLRELFAKFGAGARVALYGCGAHTEWLLDRFDALQKRGNVCVIYDDRAVPGSELRGIAVMRPQVDVSFDVLIPSSDTIESKLIQAAQRAFGYSVKLHVLYEALGCGPFPKRRSTVQHGGEKASSSGTEERTMFKQALLSEYLKLKHKYYPEYWLRPDDYGWGLKEHGYLLCVDHIKNNPCKTLLELGAGLKLYAEQHFGESHEYWMVDDMDKVPYFTKEQGEASFAARKNTRYVKGLVGQYLEELKTDYFDLTFSVSVLEHVPLADIKDVCKDLFRVTRPGGFTVHTIDVFPSYSAILWEAYLSGLRGAGFVFDAEPKPLDWDITRTDNQLLIEPQSTVYQHYGIRVPNLWAQKEMRPLQHYFWGTIQVVARKPLRKKPGRRESHCAMNELSPFWKTIVHSRRSIFEKTLRHAHAVYGKDVDPDNCDLKVYQDLLTYEFITENIPGGSAILDVGGGYSRILKALQNDYECWNVDKMEGMGNGPVGVGSTPYRLVRDYLGNFNPELPDDYFDLVFSISSLEHTPEKSPELYRNICDDLDRVLKSGGYSFHCLDAIWNPDTGWQWLVDMIDYMQERYPVIAGRYDLDVIKTDPDIYFMNEASYNSTWSKKCDLTYRELGRPYSIQLLWHRTG